MAEDINWDEILDGKFIKIVNGIPKKMLVGNWRSQTKFTDEKTGEVRKGIVLDVKQEDGKDLGPEEVKEWTVTAIRALTKLKPILQNADPQIGVMINVVRVGEGRKTEYDIKKVE